MVIGIGSAYAAEPASQPSPASQPVLSEDALLLKQIIEKNKKPSSNPVIENVADINPILNSVMTQLKSLDNINKNKNDIQKEEIFNKLYYSISEQFSGKNVSFNINVVDIKTTNRNDAFLICYDFLTNNKNVKICDNQKYLVVYLDRDEIKNINKNSKINVSGTVRIQLEKTNFSPYFLCRNSNVYKDIIVEIAFSTFKINGKEIKTHYTPKKIETNDN